MAGGPGSVYGTMYREETDDYIDYEIDEEGLWFAIAVEGLDPDHARQLYEALKIYYEEVAE